MQSVLILSGGLDSTVASYIARKECPPILALTFDYGQRAAQREIEAAGKAARRFPVPHKIITIDWLRGLTRTSLVSEDRPLPLLKESDLDNLECCRRSANAVWVPNRNGLFLNIAACFAEALGAEVLVTGFNAEEGLTFPDNSAPFVRAADEFFRYSTLKKVRVVSPTLNDIKVEIVRKARAFEIPLEEIWFCYEGGQEPCRRCESCLRAFRAFREAGIDDPWRSEIAD